MFLMSEVPLWGSGVGVWGLGIGGQGLATLSCLGFRVKKGSRCGFEVLGFRDWGFKSRVPS